MSTVLMNVKTRYGLVINVALTVLVLSAHCSLVFNDKIKWNLILG